MNPAIRIGWRRKPVRRKITSVIGVNEVTEFPVLAGIPDLEPVVFGATSAKEKLVALLQLAAEVEHVLMIQYLYTLMTVEKAKYVDPLKGIAIQEMGHFISVQNILISLEGINGVHLHKDLLRPNSQKKPLPFSLEPLSKDVLAKYTAIEMPVSLVTDPKYIPLVEHVAVLIEMRPNPVGIIYTKILELLKDRSITFPNSDDAQSEKEYWGSTAMDVYGAILEIVLDAGTASTLTREIAEQGEGPEMTIGQESHFHIFYKLFEGFQLGDETQKNIALNPTLLPNSEFQTMTLIGNEYSKLWLTLFNQVYHMLLCDIYGSLLTKEVSPTKYAERFSAFAISNMTRSHKVLGAIIMDLPVDPSPDDTLNLESNHFCGPSYELPADLGLTNNIIEYINLVVKRTDEINQTIAVIQAHKYFTDHLQQRPAISQTLTNITTDNETRIKLLNRLKNE